MTAALVQSGPMTTSGATVSCSSTGAGNLLVLLVVVSPANSTPPAGWSQAVAAAGGGFMQIWYYPNNPGGITSVVFTGTSPNITIGAILEFSGLDTTAPLDKTGSVADNTGTTSPINISTSSAITANDELAVTILNINTSAVKITITPGTGFTQAGQIGNGVKQTQHNAYDYRLDTGASSSGTTITDAMAISATGWTTITGIIATFKLPSAAAGLLPQQERHRVPITVPPYGRVMRHSPATYGR